MPRLARVYMGRCGIYGLRSVYTPRNTASKHLIKRP